jgi:hypothetical protein
MLSDNRLSKWSSQRVDERGCLIVNVVDVCEICNVVAVVNVSDVVDVDFIFVNVVAECRMIVVPPLC